MKTRGGEKFDIQFAHTSRLKNSPIIYMQRLLNKNQRLKSDYGKLENFQVNSEFTS